MYYYLLSISWQSCRLLIWRHTLNFVTKNFGLRIVSVLGIYLLCFSIAFSQSLPDDLGHKAVELATYISSNNIIAESEWADSSLASSENDSAKHLFLVRQKFLSKIGAIEQAQLKELAIYYQNLANSIGSRRDKTVADLYVQLSYIEDLEDLSISDLESELSEFIQSSDWFVKHSSLVIIVSYFSDLSEAEIALQSLEEALLLIPDEDSEYSIEAKMTTLSHLAFLYNYLKNPELAVNATSQLIELQKQYGFTVDGISLINNMIYSFSAWREFETAASLTEMLMKLEAEIEISVPGLTEMRSARLENEQGNFIKALQIGEIAQEKAELENVKNAVELNRIISLAGAGQSDEASTALDDFLEKQAKDISQSPSIARGILHAKALLAMNQGEYKSANNYYNEILKQNIQQLLSISAQQTSTKLAALQNTKDRQAEREAALQRESELQKEALDKQAQSNRLLTILLAVLSAAMIAALAFARFRSKVAKKLELSAEQAAAGEKSKSEFLALMSHELRTPLNGIIGLADFLSEQAPTADLRDKNSVILNSGHELLGLVENILDMTLIEAGEMKTYPEPTVLMSLLEDCIDHWRTPIEKKGVIFTAHIDPSVPEILNVDAKRLQQCFHNLLSNAAKFTSKGRVHVHIMGSSMEAGCARLQIIVADTGVGITHAAQQRLFQPFVQADTSMTRHYGGAGLGLAITRNLAQMMGGDVTMTSKNGRGSEFILTVSGEADSLVEPVGAEIPRISGETDGQNQDTEPRQPQRIPRRILAVDDDVSSHDVLRTILEPSGCKLVCVPNGAFALEALKENLFDLILMDIRMPAMNGIETTKIIRNSGKAYSDIPIVAVTADVAPETQDMCKAAGVDEFVAKPVSIKSLLEAFDRLDPDQYQLRQAG